MATIYFCCQCNQFYRPDGSSYWHSCEYDLAQAQARNQADYLRRVNAGLEKNVADKDAEIARLQRNLMVAQKQIEDLQFEKKLFSDAVCRIEPGGVALGRKIREQHEKIAALEAKIKRCQNASRQMSEAVTSPLGI